MFTVTALWHALIYSLDTGCTAVGPALVQILPLPAVVHTSIPDLEDIAFLESELSAN